MERRGEKRRKRSESAHSSSMPRQYIGERCEIVVHLMLSETNSSQKWNLEQKRIYVKCYLHAEESVEDGIIVEGMRGSLLNLIVDSELTNERKRRHRGSEVNGQN